MKQLISPQCFERSRLIEACESLLSILYLKVVCLFVCSLVIVLSFASLLFFYRRRLTDRKQFDYVRHLFIKPNLIAQLSWMWCTFRMKGFNFTQEQTYLGLKVYSSKIKSL